MKTDETPRMSFGKALRLRSTKSIDALFSEGSMMQSSPLLLKYNQSVRQDLSPVQFVFAVSKKKHPKASTRNTIKRRMKEACRRNLHLLQLPLAEFKMDIAIIYTPTKSLPYTAIEKAIISIFLRLSDLLLKT